MNKDFKMYCPDCNTDVKVNKNEINHTVVGKEIEISCTKCGRTLSVTKDMSFKERFKLAMQYS